MSVRRRFLFFLLVSPLFILPGQEDAGSIRETGEGARREELIRVLEERNIPFTERPLFTEYGGFGSSVHVLLPPDSPAAPAEGTFILAVPLSVIGEDAGTGGGLSFRFEAALSFIEKVRSLNKVTVRVAFLGDEVRQLSGEFQKRSHIGLEDLYDLLDNPEEAVLWYLDMAGTPRGITIHHGTADTIAPLSILKSLPALCETYHIPCGFAVRFNELYKLKLIDGPSALRFAQSRDINALYISGEGRFFPWQTPSSSRQEPVPAAEFADMLTAYVDSLQISAENFDYHFTIINLLGKTFFVSEQLTVAALLISAAFFFFALLLYSVMFRHVLIIRWQIFIRRSWILLIFLAFLMVTLQGGGILLSFILGRFRIPLQPSGAYGSAMLKLLLAMVLFSFLYPLPELLNIPRKRDFYGNAAVVLVTLGILIAIFLDITLIPLFLWAFLFIFLGASVKKPFLVYLFGLFTPIQAAVAFINILSTGNDRLAEIIRSNDLFIGFYFAVILLPFMLIFKRGAVLSRKGKPPRPLMALLIPRLVLLAGSLGIILFYGYYMAGQPAVLPVRRTITETSAERGILNIRSREIDFLERRITEVTLEARGNPVRFDMYLDTGESGTLPVIYSAPMPFELSGGRDSIEFILGEGPPNPFSTEIVIPLNFTGFLRAEAFYTSWDGTIDTLPPPESGDYVLRVVRSIPISN
jgi:hypothetical protein